MTLGFLQKFRSETQLWLRQVACNDTLKIVITLTDMILSNSTSLPRTVNVANTTAAAATLAAAPGAGKSIILVDLINGDGTNMATLKEDDSSGAVIAQVPAGGAISLNAPIKVTANKAVHVATSTKFTATYMVEG